MHAVDIYLENLKAFLLKRLENLIVMDFLNLLTCRQEVESVYISPFTAIDEQLLVLKVPEKILRPSLRPRSHILKPDLIHLFFHSEQCFSLTNSSSIPPNHPNSSIIPPSEQAQYYYSKTRNSGSMSFCRTQRQQKHILLKKYQQ